MKATEEEISNIKDLLSSNDPKNVLVALELVCNFDFDLFDYFMNKWQFWEKRTYDIGTGIQYIMPLLNGYVQMIITYNDPVLIEMIDCYKFRPFLLFSVHCGKDKNGSTLWSKGLGAHFDPKDSTEEHLQSKIKDMRGLFSALLDEIKTQYSC